MGRRTGNTPSNPRPNNDASFAILCLAWSNPFQEWSQYDDSTSPPHPLRRHGFYPSLERPNHSPFPPQKSTLLCAELSSCPRRRRWDPTQPGTAIPLALAPRLLASIYLHEAIDAEGLGEPCGHTAPRRRRSHQTSMPSPGISLSSNPSMPPHHL